MVLVVFVVGFSFRIFYLVWVVYSVECEFGVYDINFLFNKVFNCKYKLILFGVR